MDRLNVLPNERVNLTDFEDGAGGELVFDDLTRRGRVFYLPPGRTTGIAVTSARILSGFDLSGYTLSVSTSATLGRGAGFFAVYEGTLDYGYLAGSEGVASKILDFGASGAGSWDVYVRAVATPATFENRVFWNPGSAIEMVDNIPTRKVMTWDATFQAAGGAPPGNGEWIKIYEITTNGSNQITAVTDLRHLYFEGDVGSALAQEWGDGANDRNANRGAYGVGDLHRFVQAVRRQLTDSIGLPWYSLPSTSLEYVAKKKVNRIVTVNQPSGTEGDYATIAAAITALNAAQGGTILLRSGTYAITAALPDVTKKIAIVAVEDAVVIQNNLNADDFLLTFASGAADSSIDGVTFSETTTPSEQQIEILAARVLIKNCVITGAVRIGESCRFEQTEITGSTYAAHNDYTIKIDAGTNILVKFDQCRMTGGSTSHVEGLYVTSTVSGQVEFELCRFTGANGVRVIHFDAANMSGVFDECMITGYTHTANRAVVDISDGLRFSFRGGQVLATFGAVGATLAPLFRYETSTADNKSLTIAHVDVDFGGYLAGHSTVTNAPLRLKGPDITVHACQLHGIGLNHKLDTSMTTYIDCDTEGLITFAGCRFYDVSSETSDEIDMSVVGRDTNNSLNGGMLVFDQCRFDGGGKTYKHASDDSAMIMVSGGANQVHVKNCNFEGGTWFAVVYVTLVSSTVVDNKFTHTDVVTDLKHVIRLQASGSEGPAASIVCQKNTIAHRDTASEVIYVGTAVRANVCHNTTMNVEDSSPQTSIYVNTVTNIVCIGNSADNGISYSGTTNEMPASASLGTLNLLT